MRTYLQRKADDGTSAVTLVVLDVLSSPMRDERRPSGVQSPAPIVRAMIPVALLKAMRACSWLVRLDDILTSRRIENVRPVNPCDYLRSLRVDDRDFRLVGRRGIQVIPTRTSLKTTLIPHVSGERKGIRENLASSCSKTLLAPSSRFSLHDAKKLRGLDATSVQVFCDNNHTECSFNVCV